MESEIDPLSTDSTCSPEDVNKSSDVMTFEVKIERMSDEPPKCELNPKPEVTTIVSKIEHLVHGYETFHPETNVVTNDLDIVKTEQESIVKLKVKKKKDKSKKKRLYKQKANEDFQEKENPEGVPYYACAVCEVKYSTVEGLYNHVLGHKDRLTSWDLRVKNQKLKKKRKKEEKRLKKAQIKQEGIKVPEEVKLPDSISTSKDTSFDSGNQSTSLKSGDGTQNTILPSINDKKNISSPSPGKPDSKSPSKTKNKAKDKKAKDNKEGEINMEMDAVQRQALNLEKIFKCGHCNKQFHLGYYLKLHVRSHTGKSNRLHQCS